MNTKIDKKLLERTREGRRRLLALFGTPLGQQVLKDLEKHFEVELPAFQGKKGGYDPLDAMRRDAYREVFLVIRTRLAMAVQEAACEALNKEEQ